MSKKKVLMTVTSVALIATLAVGATLAFLKTTTKEVTNTFTSDRSISISLREPKWDGYGFNEETTTILYTEQPKGGVKQVSDDDYPGGVSGVKDAADDIGKTYGVNIANQYMPGDTIPKNPLVKNTCEEKVYTAITVECIDNAGNSISLEDFENQYGKINFNKTNWYEIGNKGNKRIYVYGTSAGAATVLDSNAITPAVFDKVVLKDDIGEDESGVTATLPTFKIKVNAYAIQEANISNSEAVTDLSSFINK